jgi:hypothetical protein
MAPRRPNFFIVGAPKCGTTALSQYLRDHPHVFFSSQKEPHYFALNMPRYRTVTRECDYLGLFGAAEPRHPALGEGSGYYLYSGVALEQLREFNPDARIIVMFRHPVDLVYSLHAHYLYRGNEDEPDFARAWDLQEERRHGRRIPALCRDPKILLYRDLASLGRQCTRLLDLFPRDQVKFIRAEDFRARPADIYEETLAFLGVEPDGRREFAPVNESKALRSRAVGAFMHAPPKSLVRLARRCTRLLRVQRLGLIPRLRAMNTRPYRRPPLDDAFRARLAGAFREDTQILATLVGPTVSTGV